MRLMTLLGGIIGLVKDCVKLCFWLIKRPHYIVFLIAVFVGVFYLFGVKPKQIVPFVQSKVSTFVDERKEDYMQDFSLLTQKIKGDSAPKPTKQDVQKQVDDMNNFIDKTEQGTNQKTPLVQKPVIDKTAETKQLYEQEFGWNKAFQAEQSEQLVEQMSPPSLEGVVKILTPTMLQIKGRNVQLKGVRIISGKASSAYMETKRMFDGLTGQCYIDENSNKAQCFVDGIDLSVFLIDYGYAVQK